MRRFALFCLMVASGTLAGCDLPTAVMDLVDGGSPRFESRFVFPTEDTQLRVAELLPASVQESGTNFSLAIGQTSIARTLATFCADCVPLNGTISAKPAFNDSIPVAVSLPADVSGANLVSGVVRVTLTHNFGWDPLRPAGGGNGSIVVTIRNGTRVLGTTTISEAFPSGSTIQRDIPLAAGAISGNIVASAVINSPAGDPVAINTATTLNTTAAPLNILINEATVSVQNLSVQVDQAEIDLSDVEETDRVEGGALQLRITNPFTVAGTLNLTVQGGSQPIAKQISISANQTAATPQRVSFTADEIRSLLGRNVTLSISGAVSGTGGTATVQPGQEITIDTRVEILFDLGFGGSDT